MNKTDFIDCLISMYPASFKNNENIWRDIYAQVLPDDLNFEELFDWFLVNYDKSTIAPGTGVFKEFLELHYREKHDNYETEKRNQKREELAKIRQLTAKPENVQDERLLDPLELLKSCYTTPQEFVKSMQERQTDNKRKQQEKQIFFSRSEMTTFSQFCRTLPHEYLKVAFWQSVAKLIGNKEKYVELVDSVRPSHI